MLTLEPIPERVTLNEVAALANVHVSTASRALNEATRSVVKPETIERVLAAAESLGYRPDPLARGLRTSRSRSVGVVIPDHENPIFGPIIAGIDQTLAADGYSALITAATSNNESSAVQNLVDRRVDGVILATAQRSDPVVEKLVADNLPTVLINRRIESLSVPAVVGDDSHGIRLAIDHLVELGHTAIGHIAGPDELSTGHGRRLAFEQCMRDYGFEVLVEAGLGFQIDPGEAAAARLLEREPAISAIVAANDLMGLGAYRAVANLGRKVGTDVAITGYNDVSLLDFMEPPMTALRVRFRQMGAAAAKNLLAQLHRNPVEPLTLLEPTLSIRASTNGE